MKIKEYLENLQKVSENEDVVNIYDLQRILDFDSYFYEIKDECCDRVKCYWGKKWLCTDAWVGIKFYFLDDEFVAVTTQRGRKSDEFVKFASEEKYIQFREYVLSKIVLTLDFQIVNLEEEFIY